MFSNILVGIMCVLAVAASIFGWWLENGGLSGNGLCHKEQSGCTFTCHMCNGNRYQGKGNRNKFHIRDDCQNGKPVQVPGGYSRYDDFAKGMAKIESELGSYSCHE